MELETEPTLQPTLTTADPVSPPPRRHTNMVQRLQELYRYRELIRNLVSRELKARYKNSILGFVWSLLNPLAMMLVFTVVFTVFWRNEDIDRFPIFILCGLLPWNLFSAGLVASTNSIVGNANLVKKVYFPREVLPITSVLAQLVNFLLSLILLFAAIVILQTPFSPWLWLLPIVILMQAALIIGLGLILSTLNVFYRDTMMIVDVALLAGFFLTPVFYSLDIVPSSYEIFDLNLNIHRLLYIFNPMASLINVYRDLLYWGYRTDLDFFLRTGITCFAVLGLGYWFFIRYSGSLGEEL